MAVQIRDTPFGHLTRLLSRNAMFQYPEEQVSTLPAKNTFSASGSATTNELDQSNGNRPQSSIDMAEEGKKGPETAGDEFLVGWYGPDDIEVSIDPAVCNGD